MLINDIVNYCHNEYESAETNVRCQDCKNNCAGNCEKCLDNIHFGRDRRRYNCNNIVNYYVCKYSYRYASEIEILLNTQPEIQQFDEFKILSIGCGACTDLFAFESFIGKNFLFTELQYVGVDLNKIWEPIHKKISRVADNCGIITKFIYNDIFKVKVEEIKVTHDTYAPNILSLQYVLSDMADYSDEGDIIQFIDNIINKLVIKMPDGAFIIINDINLEYKIRNDVRYNTARYYYDIFLNKILEVNKKSKFWKYHFNNSVKQQHFHYGVEHSNNDIVYNIPEVICENYNPWLSCGSAQLLIRKED